MNISMGMLVGLLPAKLQPKAKAVVAAVFGVATVAALFSHAPAVAGVLAVLNALGVHQIPNMPEASATDTQGA